MAPTDERTHSVVVSQYAKKLLFGIERRDDDDGMATTVDDDRSPVQKGKVKDDKTFGYKIHYCRC